MLMDIINNESLKLICWLREDRLVPAKEGVEEGWIGSLGLANANYYL